MNPLHPRQLTLLRIHYAIGAAALLALIIVGDLAAATRGWWPMGWASGAEALVLLVTVLLMPGRRYGAWGFAEDVDELSV